MKLAVALFVLVIVTIGCGQVEVIPPMPDAGSVAGSGAGDTSTQGPGGQAGTYIAWPPGSAGSVAGSIGAAGTNGQAGSSIPQAGTSGGAGTGAAGVMAIGSAGSTGMAGSAAGTIGMAGVTGMAGTMAEAAIKVEYRCDNCGTPGSGDWIKYSLRITNNGMGFVSLDTYTVYYWFSYPLTPGNPYGNVSCSVPGNSGSCSSVVKPYTPFTPGGQPESPLPTANLMEEVKFKGVQVGSDSNYPVIINIIDGGKQSSEDDDYSFNGNDIDFSLNLHIAVFANGTTANSGAKPVQGILPIVP